MPRFIIHWVNYNNSLVITAHKSKNNNVWEVVHVNGGEQIAKVLQKQGVKFLFTLCGGHIAPILVECNKLGIQVIDTRQEATAVFAADAVSRLSGIPGVAAVTAGPGVTNSITAIVNANKAQSPLILLGGSIAQILKGRGALQDLDQLALLKSVVKWETAINKDCDVEERLDKAFQVAQSGVPGPVFVQCPIDVLYEEELVRKMYVGSSVHREKEPLSEHLTHLYLNRQVDHIFACAVEDLPPTDPLLQKDFVEVSPPDFHDASEGLVNVKDIDHTIDLIKHASHPVMLVGSQVVLHSHLVPQVNEALGQIRIPVFLAGMARGLLPANNPLFFHKSRAEALREADLVILAGVPLDFRLNYGRVINHNAVQVAINRDREDLTRNRKPELGVLGDPASFLIALGNAMSKQGADLPRTEWRNLLAEAEDKQRRKLEALGKEKVNFINPIRLCKEIDANLDPNSIIVADGGDFVATASYIIHPRKPLSWLDPGPYGTLGVGAGFALGAKLVRPDAEVWILYGDGAAGYSLIEFDTFVRHKVPVIAIIGNDAGWAQIARDQVELLHDPVGTVLRHSDYQKIADGLGGKGFLIKDASEIADCMREAKKTAASGTPVLINALIGTTDFRKGSISM